MTEYSKRLTFERREGQMTQFEYRASMFVNGVQRFTNWCYTKRDARAEASVIRGEQIPIENLRPST